VHAAVLVITVPSTIEVRAIRVAMDVAMVVIMPPWIVDLAMLMVAVPPTIEMAPMRVAMNMAVMMTVPIVAVDILRLVD
jgi:hypothetical protein